MEKPAWAERMENEINLERFPPGETTPRLKKIDISKSETSFFSLPDKEDWENFQPFPRLASTWRGRE